MTIYTDGSAHPNPGPGGFGLAVFDEKDRLIDKLSVQKDGPVTNNEMELTAIVTALYAYGVKVDEVSDFNAVPVVYTDSAYCYNALTNWMYSWERNGWKKSDNKTPENLILFQTYFQAYNEMGLRIELRKIKGHSNIWQNELVDALATGNTNKYNKILKQNQVEIIKKI